MNAPLPLTSTASQFSKWFDPLEVLQGVSLMDHLFNRLDGAYPHKWRSNFPHQQAIDNWSISWAEAFEEEGIMPHHIKAGLKACRNKYEWPPSCAEFIKACKPSIDPTVAYYEAIAGVAARAKGEIGEWSSPAIFWAAMPLSFDLGQQTYSQIKTRWEKALMDQLEKGEWAPIPKPMIQLAAPGKTQSDRDAATKALQNIGASGVLKRRSEDTIWYRKILERHKKGDKTLTPIQISFAKEAARNHGIEA